MKARNVWRLLALFALANLLLVGWGLTRRSAANELRVTFLDVGQGDSAILETPSGKVMVIDTGGLTQDGGDEGDRVVAPFLRYRGINRIDALVLSHADADHTGGAHTLLERFPVNLLLDNGVPATSQVITRLLTEAGQHHVPVRTARRGQTLDCGDGVTARVLAPTEAEAALGVQNNASVVLAVTYGRTAFLFPGDAEADEESELAHSNQSLGCDVLKIAHHGSHTSTTPEFLSASHPRLAVISVGAHNLYGHPAPDVVERLRARGTRLYRTDRNGAITCRSDGVTIQIETMHP